MMWTAESARDIAGRFYPVALSQDTLEAHFARFASRGRAMYLAIVMLCAAAAAALPLVRIDVWVESQGIIRPLTDKHEIRAMVSGPVEALLVTENQRVRSGDALLAIRADDVDDRGARLGAELAEKEREESDLGRLVALDTAATRAPGAWRTTLYAQEYARFATELRAALGRAAKAREEWRRVQTLESQRFATRSDLEDRAFALDQATADATLVLSRAHAQWQATLTALRGTLADLRTQRRLLGTERSLYTLSAPIDGTIEDLRSLSRGSYLQSGERIAVISPAAALVAEVWVTPRDIGRVRPGLAVRLLIDAFNFHDWGVVDATVVGVSDDYALVDGRPVFKVRCAIAHTRLERHGTAADLRKGMTLRARFIVGRRSLLQLMRGRMDEWIA